MKKRADSDRSRSGAAMAGSGAVITGTGLLTGGIPGAKEPDKNGVWNLRGNGAREMASRKNIRHNLRQGAPLPRAGILGFRASAHAKVIDDINAKGPGQGYVQGNRAGKLEAEKKVLRGMRLARKATYPVTIGGAALTAAGLNRMNSKPVKKRDRQRSAEVGVAGAAAGGTAGLYAGVRGGASVGSKTVERNIKREYERANNVKLGAREVPVGNDLFSRRSKALMRGVKGGALLGTGTLGVAGYNVARGDKIHKASLSEENSAAALGTGAGLAGVGHFVPKKLDKYGRRYERSSIAHIKAAQKLAPGFGGVKSDPARTGAWGQTTRRARELMEPQKTDAQLNASNAADRIKGGRNSERAKQVGYHRGVATNEKHFAEVFENTSRAVRRARTPGLLLAAAGAGGLMATSGNNRAKTKINKMAPPQYGYQETRLSPMRATGTALGVALMGYGGSRNGMLARTLARGARTPGNRQTLYAQAEKARARVEDVTGTGAKMLKQKVGSGYRLRNSEALLGGGALTYYSVPVHQKKFSPVRAPHMQGGY